MPDKIPEDMPDRMSEDMSDSMLEDLPVTRRIHVMVTWWGELEVKDFLSAGVQVQVYTLSLESIVGGPVNRCMILIPSLMGLVKEPRVSLPLSH